MSLAEPAPAASAGLSSGASASRTPREKSLALAVLAISQLMVVLDATIVNVALREIQTALRFEDQSDLQWVVTGYALTFGGFLLLGGKLADRLGRRKVFMAGAVLFAVASLLGGITDSSGLLIAARALQGLGGALMSPAALSLLTVVFEEGEERDKALGVWAAITAGGAALGLILGGLLTDYLSWRWVFFVNLPIAAVAIVGTLRYVPESRDENARGFDVLGAVLVTGGLMSLVYGFAKFNDDGYSAGLKTAFFVIAAVLLAAFVVVQKRVTNPLLPFRLFRSRSLTGADTGILLIGAGIFGIFFFLTLWMQIIHGWSPTRTGFAFLPMTFLIGAAAGVGSKLLGKVGPRPLLTVGPLLAAAGLLQLAVRLAPDSTYVGTVLPALAFVALGMGLTFVAATSAAVAGVPSEDAGVASALLNAGQQVGGALGLAILTAVSTARTESLLPPGAPSVTFSEGGGGPEGAVDPAAQGALFEAITSGWGAGFFVATGFLVLAAVVMNALIRVSAADAEKALKEGAAAAG